MLFFLFALFSPIFCQIACNTLTDCTECQSEFGCAWCGTSDQGGGSCSLASVAAQFSCVSNGGQYQPEDCAAPVSCGALSSCSACADRVDCAFCAQLPDAPLDAGQQLPGACVDQTSSAQFSCLAGTQGLWNPPSCTDVPLECGVVSDCDTCSERDGCSWCVGFDGTGECFQTTAANQFTCISELSGFWEPDSCDFEVPCDIQPTCEACSIKPGCGWCASLTGTQACLDDTANGAFNCFDQFDGFWKPECDGSGLTDPPTPAPPTPPATLAPTTPPPTPEPTLPAVDCASLADCDSCINVESSNKCGWCAAGGSSACAEETDESIVNCLSSLNGAWLRDTCAVPPAPPTGATSPPVPSDTCYAAASDCVLCSSLPGCVWCLPRGAPGRCLSVPDDTFECVSTLDGVFGASCSATPNPPRPTPMPSVQPTAQPTAMPTSPPPTPVPTAPFDCDTLSGDCFRCQGTADCGYCLYPDGNGGSCSQASPFSIEACTVIVGGVWDPPGCVTPNPTPQPTPNPTPKPTTQPTFVPTTQPTPQPTSQPTTQPTPLPTTQPTAFPTAMPSPGPQYIDPACTALQLTACYGACADFNFLSSCYCPNGGDSPPTFYCARLGATQFPTSAPTPTPPLPTTVPVTPQPTAMGTTTTGAPATSTESTLNSPDNVTGGVSGEDDDDGGSSDSLVPVLIVVIAIVALCCVIVLAMYLYSSRKEEEMEERQIVEMVARAGRARQLAGGQTRKSARRPGPNMRRSSRRGDTSQSVGDASSEDAGPAPVARRQSSRRGAPPAALPAGQMRQRSARRSSISPAIADAGFGNADRASRARRAAIRSRSLINDGADAPALTVQEATDTEGSRNSLYNGKVTWSDFLEHNVTPDNDEDGAKGTTLHGKHGPGHQQHKHHGAHHHHHHSQVDSAEVARDGSNEDDDEAHDALVARVRANRAASGERRLKPAISGFGGCECVGACGAKCPCHRRKRGCGSTSPACGCDPDKCGNRLSRDFGYDGSQPAVYSAVPELKERASSRIVREERGEHEVSHNVREADLTESVASSTYDSEDSHTSSLPGGGQGCACAPRCSQTRCPCRRSGQPCVTCTCNQKACRNRLFPLLFSKYTTEECLQKIIDKNMLYTRTVAGMEDELDMLELVKRELHLLSDAEFYMYCKSMPELGLKFTATVPRAL